jgi:hypothetical protein
LFIVNLAIGVMTVAAIALWPLYAERVRWLGSARIGATLVLASITLGAASASRLARSLPPRNGLFFGLFAGLLLGSFLILADEGGGDDSDGGPDDPGGDPPWWPDFEAGFRSYARQPRYPVGRA